MPPWSRQRAFFCRHGRSAKTPTLGEDQIFQRQAVAPALHLKFGRFVKLVHMADAEIGYRHHMVGQVQDRADIGLVIDADPANAYPLGAGRQPKILRRADGGIQVLLISTQK